MAKEDWKGYQNEPEALKFSNDKAEKALGIYNRNESFIDIEGYDVIVFDERDEASDDECEQTTHFKTKSEAIKFATDYMEDN